MQTFWALLLTVLLAWVLASRFSGKIDPSWQLLVWVFVVVFASFYEGLMHPTVLYIGVVCALLLRFEFMGGFVLKAVRFFEGGSIVFLLSQLFIIVRGY
jgi:hypothetical protein